MSPCQFFWMSGFELQVLWLDVTIYYDAEIVYELQQFRIKNIEAKIEKLRKAHPVALGDSVLLFRLALLDNTE